MPRALLLRSIPSFLLCSLTLSGAAQLTVDNTQTPLDLVNNILVGQGVAVSNVTFNGLPATSTNQQIGSFDGTSSNIGMNEGIVLATGRVELVSGPNQNPSLTLSPSSPLNVPDPDLAMIESMLRCVAVLEFDFVPIGDSISFRFVFGSEEYPEFVCSQYNDAFGFFLSGPGLSGGFSNNAINLGVLPGGSAPIAINTVNSGVPGLFGSGASTCAASDPGWQSNSPYYVDNVGGPTVELDGFTVPIRAVAAVRCGETYHIKIAIAHAGDATLDSAVLIEGGSFSSESVLSVEVQSPQANGTLTEGCGEAIVTVERGSINDPATITLSYSGTADDDDLIDAPTSVVIPAGSSSISFPLAALADEVPDDAESLTITATWVGGCGEPTGSTNITLLDHVPIVLTAEDVYLNCDQDSTLLQVSVSGGLGTVNTAWSNGTIGDGTTVTGLQNGVYTVWATDECPQTVGLSVNVHAGCEISIPNVFTPNGDGHNDAWVIGGLGRSRHSVRVFNRWGQTIFESRNYNNGWRAMDVPDGTYFYEVLSEGTPRPFTGSLTILRNGRR
ncbi:MAG TPA: choice-of-anchor L domain-containing protein [Flavobacteriales bacterium]